MQFKTILKQYWGYDDFRGIQREIIESISSGHDTLGLMPTGGGKSITFQVPALAAEGICIVITPLIALMKDQVQHLRDKGIKAAAIYTGMTHTKVLVTLENCIFGDYKLLYISPERISSPLFQAKLSHMRISFICVDEAHCVSQWGYDFRPSYLEIKEIRKKLPDAPLLALTATATPTVIDDIQQQLQFKNGQVFRMSFERKNLAYKVINTDQKEKTLKRLLTNIPGSTIIYCRSRRNCLDLSKLVQEWGFSATYYHAGLSDSEKDERQQKWQKDKIRVMVATNAFGMGIDKSDVRLVLHVSPPDCIESYFQEAGRAGRDGQFAQAYLLYRNHDATILRRRINEAFPSKEKIREIYEQVCCYLQIAVGFGQGMRREFNILEFCRKFRQYPTITESALNLLTKAGYINYTDQDEGTSRLMFIVRRDELYHYNDPELDLITQALFRQYPGLFINYVPIDEVYVAKATGLTDEVVYNKLKEYTKRHVWNYIPRKNIPHITFTIERQEKEHICISKSIYEERKAILTKQIDAITEYVKQQDICRCKYLLKYFGENIKKDCQQCDICLEKECENSNAIITSEDIHANSKNSSEFRKTIRDEIKAIKQIIHQSIIEQLSEGPVHPFMLKLDEYDPTIASEVLQEMSDNQEICTNEQLQIELSK